MKSLLPLLVLIVMFVGLLAFSARARRRQGEKAAQQAARIAVGSEVMTTSGLYGTVVARNDDDSVVLAIAPGVEVRWALAALRDVESLPGRYQPAGPGDDAAGRAGDTGGEIPTDS